MLQRHMGNKQQIAYQLAQQKEAAIVEKIRYVQQLARECGVDEGNKQLWYKVFQITKDDDNMEFFIGTSTPHVS